MRPPGPLIPAARALHQQLLDRGIHPTGDNTGASWSETTSPCDGCVDLAEVVVNAYFRPPGRAHARSSTDG